MSANVLFICSGNYYRSRFAEHFFQHLANQANSDARAFSRAMATDLAGRNPGPISPHALRGLQQRGIELETPIRFPRSLSETDLKLATHIIAVKESEHRPWMDTRFPAWTSRVEFWRIDDIDVASPDDALPLLEARVRETFERVR